MNFVKKRGLYSWLLVVSAILALITVILGATQKAMTTNYNFSTPLIIVMVAGVVAAIVNLFLRLDFMPLLASILFGGVWHDL